MNGWIVAEKLRERPPETLLIEPYVPDSGARGYFAARDATEALETHPGDPEANARSLTRFILNHDPSALDVVPSMTNRYQQAAGFMDRYPSGQEKLAEVILDRFITIHQCLEEGFVPQTTNTIIFSDPKRPPNQMLDGNMTQRLNLPPIIQARSLVWNEWAQQKIEDGQMGKLFTDEIYRHGVKVANGDLLPAGNLWVEVGEGLARIRGYHHWASELEVALGLGGRDYDDDSLTSWYVMSHIAEKGILDLSASLGPNMIDGKSLTDETYVKSYPPIVGLIDLNPHLDIKGILSDGSWIYSEELARVFPDQHVSKLHDVAGKVVELGPAEEIGKPIQAMFATLHPGRKAAYEAGEYRAGVAARFIDRGGMLAVTEQFGIDS